MHTLHQTDLIVADSQFQSEVVAFTFQAMGR